MMTIAVGVAVSCASAAPPEDGPAVDSGEYNADRALEQAYDAHRANIILDGAKKYTVKSGDTLSKITIANYGSANDYGYFFPLIMMASPEAGVGDPELIEPGMVLTIPDLQKNLDNAEARAAIKAFLLDIAKIYGNINKAHSALTQENLTALSNSL
jgi:nucleoid-associated protein YgaU